jgi:hypothetical protein
LRTTKKLKKLKFVVIKIPKMEISTPPKMFINNSQSLARDAPNFFGGRVRRLKTAKLHELGYL